MSLDKRDYSNFDRMGGKICKERNMYVFPTLYKSDKFNHCRIWSIFIRLVKKTNIQITCNDWNKLLESTINMENQYLYGKMPQDIIAQTWTETGVVGGKITIHSPTYTEAKNIGKINERSSFQTALILARKEYIKKLESGFKPKEQIDDEFIKYISDDKYFPMTLSDYSNDKDNLVYPLYIQPKLDGTRCIVYLNTNPKKSTLDNVIMYTRQLHSYPRKYKLLINLYKILVHFYDTKNDTSVYLDGEIYEHGKTLEYITSKARTFTEINDNDLNFHMFDLFYPQRLCLTFASRLFIIDMIFKYFNFDNIFKVKTILCEDEKTSDDIYKDFLKNKYEGAVYRNILSTYATYLDNTKAPKSKKCLKRKQLMSNEFKIVDYTSGKKGNKKGSIIWICENNDKQRFKVTPKGITDKESEKIFIECETDDGFEKKYKNRLLTVIYMPTYRNIPKSAKSVGFRDFL